MAWFKRKDKGIQTPTEAKRDTPKGLWYKISEWQSHCRHGRLDNRNSICKS